jgi:hypothetical protein
MKTVIFAAATAVLGFTNAALAAESVITLNFKSPMLTSQESGAAMVDLSGEIKKQSAATKLAGQRIKSVEVDGQASFMGATVMLLISNQAVDSQSVDAGTTAPIILNSSYPRSPGAWALGIRGQMTLTQIKITIDDEDLKAPILPLDPLVRNDPNAQGGSGGQATIDNGPAVVVVPTAPVQPGQQSVNSDFDIGETVIAVSSTSGLIDYVTIVSDDGGSYTISYDGRDIPEWTRNQLAKTTGCNADLCVGATMNRLGDNLTIVGLLTGDNFVVQKSNQKYLVVNRSNLAIQPARPTPARPAPAQPVPPPPRPAGPTRSGRYQVGQKAYLVLDAQHVYTTTINAIRPNGSVDLLMQDGTSRNITRSDQIAVIYGCAADGTCVGDQIQTVAGNGRYYSGRVVGIQSNDFAVLTLQGLSGLVGYWPIQSLEK